MVDFVLNFWDFLLLCGFFFLFFINFFCSDFCSVNRTNYKQIPQKLSTVQKAAKTRGFVKNLFVCAFTAAPHPPPRVQPPSPPPKKTVKTSHRSEGCENMWFREKPLRVRIYCCSPPTPACSAPLPPPKKNR